MKVDSHLSWCLVAIAFGWVVIAMLQGCGNRPLLTCDGPEVGSTEATIIDGTVPMEQYGTVSVRGAGGGACTGTVIGPTTVLTAAHCTDMRLVCKNLTADCAAVEGDIEHPNAVKPGPSDLRVLTVPDLADLGLLEIPLGTAEGCSRLLVQGFGKGSGGVLMEREVRTCNQTFGVIHASEGICNGDSGGPMYCMDGGEPVLVGVASWGYDASGLCRGATGFVDVEYNRFWIEGNTK